MHRRFGVPLIVTSHGETLADDRGSSVPRRCCVSAASGDRSRRGRHGAVGVRAGRPARLVWAGRRNGGAERGGSASHADPTTAPQASGGRYLLGVGRLGRMKGFDLLIDAFAAAELDPGIRLVIGGEGPQRELLEELIERRGLREPRELVGRLSPQAVADAMAGALAVVVPSRMEAFGIVALEAWRSGTALVMTSRGGASEFVRDGVDGTARRPRGHARPRPCAVADLRRPRAARSACCSRPRARPRIQLDPGRARVRGPLRERR